MSIAKYGRDIGEFVHRYRQRNQLSQRELGKMLKVGGQYVSNIERNVHVVPAAFCMRLIKLLGPTETRYLKDLLSESMDMDRAKKLDKIVKKTRRIRRQPSK